MIICVVFILSTCDTSHFHFPLKQFKDTATITTMEKKLNACQKPSIIIVVPFEKFQNLNKMLTLLLLLFVCINKNKIQWKTTIISLAYGERKGWKVKANTTRSHTINGKRSRKDNKLFVLNTSLIAFNPHLNIWYYLSSKTLKRSKAMWLKSISKIPVFHFTTACAFPPVKMKEKKHGESFGFFLFSRVIAASWSISWCKYLKSALILLSKRLLSIRGESGQPYSFLIIGFIGESISIWIHLLLLFSDNNRSI